MFTREIEKQLIVRRIDLAVHSAKDLPSEGWMNWRFAARSAADRLEMS